MSANLTGAKPVKQVPNGRVYRQLFEAQAQLVRSLNQHKDNERRHDEPSLSKAAPLSARSLGIPVVQDPPMERNGGMLTERQRSWIVSESNDPYTENPVFLRQVANIVSHHVDVRGDNYDVLALPDVVIPSKMGSDIIGRIAENRRQRHEAAVEDMFQDLAMISSELEPRIAECGERLMARMAENDAEIAGKWVVVEHERDLLSLDRNDLYNLWVQIQEHSSARRTWIEELDQSLDKVEMDRVRLVRAVFASYANILSKIAHLMTPDLQRFLDSESQAVNQAILSNRRAYNDLYARLMILDIEREKRQYTSWSKRVEDWRRMKINTSADAFKSFMTNHVISRPLNVEDIKHLMQTELTTLNLDRRLELIRSLGDLRPPQSTKAAVYLWNQQVQDITQQVDNRCQHYLMCLRREYEVVREKGMEEVERLKSELLESGVCDDQQANQVIDEQFLPLIGEQQKQFENELELMDRQMDEVNRGVMANLESLFRFAQGAAHVWDVHEVDLARQERALQEKLENARRLHDIQNQEKETNLDIVMDKLRQDATEPTLREDLKKALDMMEKIKATYYAFHKTQKDLVSAYPDLVREELSCYDENVCKYFALDRIATKPSDDVVKDESETDTKTETEEIDEQQPALIEDPAPTPDTSVSDVASAMAEVLSTARGTTFYVLSEAGVDGIPPDALTPEPRGTADDDAECGGTAEKFFLTETSADDGAHQHGLSSRLLDCIALETKDFIAVKKQIRMNFLDHLDTWAEESLTKAECVVVTKTEELRSELDLRLYLHHPRPRRAEMDIHNVRAAELIMHGERVTRHCKGINQVLTEQRQIFTDLNAKHELLLAQYRDDTQSLETVFINATKSSKLVALSNRLSEDKEKFMATVRTSLRASRQNIDQTLHMLRDSNGKFLKSFKLFSDGGNFCPEEVDDYRHRLEKMAQLIDSAEGSLLEDLEGLESRRLDQATKISTGFEDRFKNHMVDLVFIERITRWMTNTQVRIKSEVAFSNSMTGTIVNHLEKLDRRIDACQKPSFDKETITSRQLYDSLSEIFESFRDRAVYLHCLVDLSAPQTVLQGPPAIAVTRVGFISDVTPSSKAGAKGGAQDDYVNIMKNIMKSHKVSKNGGVEPAAPEVETIAKTPRSHGTSTDNAGGATATATGGASGAASAAQSTLAVTERHSARVGRQGKQSRTGAPSTAEAQPRRLPSGGRRGVPLKGKMDKKYLVFGDDREETPDHFLGKIRKICRVALDGLLTSAETYYRHKGGRLVTRPDVLQDSFEHCGDLMLQKIQSYYQQSDEYHNECLQEFRRHIEKFELLVTGVPQLVVADLTRQHLTRIDAKMASIDNDFAQKQAHFEAKRLRNQSHLRPNLGHPQHAEHLLALVDEEEARSGDYLRLVDEYSRQLSDAVGVETAEYVSTLAKTCEKALLDLDSLLTSDDIQRGRGSVTKYTTSQLLRRQLTGRDVEEEEAVRTTSTVAPPWQKKTWPGLLRNEMYVGANKPPKLFRTATVTTAKVTMAHSALQEARDKAYQEYKANFHQLLVKIAERRQNLVVEEQRWKDNWLVWVAKVKLLY